MTISNMFIMDLKGKVIISRNYRGDVPMNASDRFANYIQERDEMEQRPIFTDGGLTFAFIKVNNLLLMCITKHNSNIALLLMYLYRLAKVCQCGVSKDYFTRTGVQRLLWRA